MKRWLTTLLLAIGLLMLLGSLYLLSSTTENSADFDRLHGWLLLLNATGAAVLIVLIATNVYALVKQYRERVPGARLAARMVMTFAGLAVVPIAFMYYFSFQFISRGIDSWFDVRVEQALDDALELSRAALELRMRELLTRTEHMAAQLAREPEALLDVRLERLRRESGAFELTVFGEHGRIIATSALRPGFELPARPGEDVMLQLGSGVSYVGLEPASNNGFHVRAVVALPRGLVPGAEARLLQGLFPVAERLRTLAENVQSEYVRYRELTVLRTPLKYSFVLSLSLVLLVSLLTAVWGAFFWARRMVRPIRDLAAGTRAVARGDFDTRLPLTSRDDVGLLVLSFNEMTRRLAEAREEARRSQQQVESERAWLQAVLSRLTTGVVTLDAERRLRTANQAAAAILGVELDRHAGRPFTRLRSAGAVAEQFCDACEARFQSGASEWREEIVLAHGGSQRILMCSCTTLPGEGAQAGGYVLVFDELTALFQAQRDAAWGEVARRLAHEIKNPLTPIQLAAERLRQKYLSRFEGADAEFLERSTRTIIQQVETMQAMVKAFSEYARTPAMEISRFSLNALVAEVAELYHERTSGVRMKLDLDATLPAIEADSGRVRQMLHNLIKNSMEALEGRNDGRIGVATRLVREGEARFAEIAIEDNGPGFALDILGKAFEPYVTSKPKGTGLGLAIVKKLTEEHAGTINAENLPEGGARITIRLPLDEQTHASMLARAAGRRRDERRNTVA